MNKRIAQLLAQAHLEVEDVKNTNKIAEKFAELLIKECAKCCTSATQEGQPLHLVSLGYAQRIKQHFGVKE